MTPITQSITVEALEIVNAQREAAHQFVRDAIKGADGISDLAIQAKIIGLRFDGEVERNNHNLEARHG